MLKGRLGLETARIPHSDRHGLLWLSFGALSVRNGSLVFERSETADPESALDSGRYAIPFQTLSMILLGPGTTVSHDALRLMARHGTGMVAVGADGVRCYTAPPIGPDSSKVARLQMSAWSDRNGGRLEIARKMYALRLGEVLPHQDINTLRGIEGARMKRTYQIVAQRTGVQWRGRRYDRSNPAGGDIPNQCINHAATAVNSAAVIAVTSVGAINQLGFIHEHSGMAFALDIGDLFRATVTIPIAFESALQVQSDGGRNLERVTRANVGRVLRKDRVISKMIGRIKGLFGISE